MSLTPPAAREAGARPEALTVVAIYSVLWEHEHEHEKKKRKTVLVYESTATMMKGNKSSFKNEHPLGK